MDDQLAVRDALPDELVAFGKLLVAVYSDLDGFPPPSDQPRYYELLADVGRFARAPGARVLVAVSARDGLLGGVVYFGDMAEYGSDGSATSVRNASGIRLLGVSPRHRKAGVGRMLSLACIEMAREKRHAQVILHTTRAMGIAWRLYEKLGFRRADEFDFLQGSLPVYGFRLWLAGGEGAAS